MVVGRPPSKALWPLPTRPADIEGPVEPSPSPSVLDMGEPHKSKVCAVLLPIYPAAKFLRDDVYKGYDKITTSPTHKMSLPKWEVSPELLKKYGQGRF